MKTAAVQIASTGFGRRGHAAPGLSETGILYAVGLLGSWCEQSTTERLGDAGKHEGASELTKRSCARSVLVVWIVLEL